MATVMSVSHAHFFTFGSKMIIFTFQSSFFKCVIIITQDSERLLFLYASVVGPIVEELIYRGFVLRSFQKYGKIAAIIISSILFGVMHANIPQGMFAFAVGLVLGYVAIEYSIWWAIALHIFNNCIFNDLFGMALSGLNEQMQNMISIVVIVFFGIAGGFILWKNRHRIKKYIEENRTEKRVYFYIFSAVGMFLFIAAEMFIAITSLQKI